MYFVGPVPPPVDYAKHVERQLITLLQTIFDFFEHLHRFKGFE